jgi:hypothetical protein
MEFLEEKQYFESDQRLTGFYGTKTVDDYLKYSRRLEDHEQRRKASQKRGQD